MNYIVLKGDIINSRDSKNRDQIQQTLSRRLKELNKKYKDVIAAEFMITSGDGFQGLMKSAVHLFDITDELEDSIPIKLRFGIGIGTLSTSINHKNSALIDGPCYHRADDMLSDIKAQEQQNTAPRANIRIGSDTQYDGVLNGLLSLRYVIKSSWTPRQTEVTRMYKEQSENQHQTAAQLGVNQSTVSRALKVTDYYSVKSAEAQMLRFIQEVII